MIPHKIVVFDQDPSVRKLLKDSIEQMSFVQESGYFVEALPEPWNAKDQVDADTALVVVGHYANGQIPEWSALHYVRDVPGNVPVIAGSACWDSEMRDAFVRAGAHFTYDRPVKLKGLEGMVKAALKVGHALKRLRNDKDYIVATHLGSGNDVISVYSVPKK
ncbi:MAG: response regulator [Candidatus Woesearchaeota archaeon]